LHWLRPNPYFLFKNSFAACAVKLQRSPLDRIVWLYLPIGNDKIIITVICRIVLTRSMLIHSFNKKIIIFSNVTKPISSITPRCFPHNNTCSVTQDIPHIKVIVKVITVFTRNFNWLLCLT
jgi:hypothetical protein